MFLALKHEDADCFWSRQGWLLGSRRAPVCRAGKAQPWERSLALAGNVPMKSRCWASPGENARDPPSLPLHRIPAWSWGATVALVAQGLRQALGAEGEELRLQQQLLRC